MNDPQAKAVAAGELELAIRGNHVVAFLDGVSIYEGAADVDHEEGRQQVLQALEARMFQVLGDSAVVDDAWRSSLLRRMDKVKGRSAQPTQARAAGPIKRLARTLGSLIDVEPEPERWLLRRNTIDGQRCPQRFGDPFLPRGEVALLTAGGGSGKTQAAIQLAVSLASGRPWLGAFDGPSVEDGGKVLLILGEENLERTHRRFRRTIAGMTLTEQERAAVSRDVMIAPLAGEPACPLLRQDGYEVTETEAMAELRTLLADPGDGRGWQLVVIDPQSRLCGIDAEADNALATRWIQAVETLTKAPGRPVVLILGHSSKLSQLSGRSDARGVSGQGDAARFHATLSGKGKKVVLSVAKNNYAPPCEDLSLERGEGGVLVAVGSASAEGAEELEQSRANARLEADVVRVVTALGKMQRGSSSKKAIAAAAGVRKQDGIVAVEVAIDRGLICRSGPQRAPSFMAHGPGCVCGTSPHTPRGPRDPEGLGSQGPQDFGFRDPERTPSGPPDPEASGGDLDGAS